MPPGRRRRSSCCSAATGSTSVTPFWYEVADAVVRHAARLHARRVTVAAGSASIHALRAFAEGLSLARYRFTRYRSRPAPAEPLAVTLAVDAVDAARREALRQRRGRRGGDRAGARSRQHAGQGSRADGPRAPSARPRTARPARARPRPRGARPSRHGRHPRRRHGQRPAALLHRDRRTARRARAGASRSSARASPSTAAACRSRPPTPCRRRSATWPAPRSSSA